MSRTTYRLSQELKTFPEERLENLGRAGGFGFADGGLGIGAGGAEIEERGQNVLLNSVEGGCGGGGASGGNGDHFVAEFENHAFGGFLSYTGDADELFDGAVAESVDEIWRGETGKDGNGEFGADSGDADELLEHGLFILGEEAEEGERVFAHVGVDAEANLCADVGQACVGGNGNGEVVTDAACLHNRLGRVFFEERATDESNHQ